MTNIIIMDSRPYIRYRVKDLIEKTDTLVHEAANSAQLFNKLRELNNEVDLLILDINLRDEDGIEVVKRMKKRQIEIPFMVLTSINTKDAFIRSVKAGAIDYFLKPFDDQLFAKRVLRHSKGEHIISEDNSTAEEIDFTNYLDNEIDKAIEGNQKISAIMFILFKTNEDVSIDINHEDKMFSDAIFNQIKALTLGVDRFDKHGSNTFIGIYPNCDETSIKDINDSIIKRFEETQKEEASSEFYFDSVYATYPNDGDTRDKLMSNLEWKINEKILNLHKTNQ
jgi:DNA-binding response OmpR family regulator